MRDRIDYAYEAYTTPAVTAIRIPQQEWAQGAPPLGANGLPVLYGTVQRFSLAAGVGTIISDEAPGEIFFHFTAIPGQGYRTITPGTSVQFELMTSATGLSAHNIQRVEPI
jgi:cold shock CspA family protein